MNASKKFGLKKASQIRNLSEFTKEELDEINNVKKDDSIEGDKDVMGNFQEKKNLEIKSS
jgi:hypothetical protein